MKTHIALWMDAAQTAPSANTICGRAISHAIVLAPGQFSDKVDCKPCIKRWSTERS